MSDFLKRVKLVGGSRIMFHYPLSNGMDLFEAGQEYEIKNAKDFARLMDRGDFVCIDEVVPDPVVVEEKDDVNEETEDDGSFLSAVRKRGKKGDKQEEVTN